MSEIADRNSWKNQPLPPQRAKINFERTFSEQEYSRLSQGIIPKVMEDKWFIFMENDILFFHRSWTGVCIYEVHLDNKKRVCKALVNRNDEHYKETNNEYDEKILTFLIENFLLEKDIPIQMPTNTSNSKKPFNN